MRNLRSRYIQVDEMHGYVQVRQKNLDPMRHDELTQGEQYIFIAIDAETKLIPSFVVGKWNDANAYWLMKDLESRLANRILRPMVSVLTPMRWTPHLEATWILPCWLRSTLATKRAVNATALPRS